VSLSEELLEEALLLGLVVLGALRSRALLGGRGPDGALVQVRVTANEVHRALDVRKHLNLLHLREQRPKALMYDRKKADLWCVVLIGTRQKTEKLRSHLLVAAH